LLRAVPWLAVGSLLSGVISVGFVVYLWGYRDRLGGRFFIATIACEALWALSYGVALLVFDPVLRRAFEIPIWLAINFIGVFFLAFALEYTGRGGLLRSKLMGGIVLLQTVHTLVVVTNPLHHIAWSDYTVEPVFGAATVAYAHQPWLFVNATGFVLMIAVGSFLLADTVFSYGPLYRTQAAAIALSPVFPGFPFLLWLFQAGNTPPLNLTPLVFPIHLVFDMYAFFSRDLFEMVPAARRAADRTAIENLGSAVVIVDAGERIIELNDEAERLLGVDADVLGVPLDAVLDGVDPSGTDEPISLTVAGRRREYAVTTSPLEDSSGSPVGDTIVLQDVTAERRREQRLAVLNRVLRHNLRNDLNVVQGYLDVARERSDDPSVEEMLQTAAAKTSTLTELGEKARRIDQVMQSDGSATEAVAVAALLDDVAADLRAAYPDGRIRVDVPEDLHLRANALLLEGVFTDLAENALEHNDADHPEVEVLLRESDAGDGRATFEVRDNGPGVPDYELDVLTEAGETALEHGSGLGLWLVRWGVELLGGDLRFDADEAGTTVILELPTAAADDAT